MLKTMLKTKFYSSQTINYICIIKIKIIHMKKFITTPVLIATIGSIVIGVLLGRMTVDYNHDVTCVSEKQNTALLVKGGVYEKEFYKNSSDPFAKVEKDTIVILDLQESKRNGYTYAKWTYQKWNDTTRFISTDALYLSENTKRIK